MLPLGISLTSRATKDRGLFEFDNYLDPLKKFLKLKPKAIFDQDGKEISYTYFEGYSDEKLMAILKDPTAHNLDQNSKAKAFSILYKRGVSLEDLQSNGLILDDSTAPSLQKAKDVMDYSRFAFVFYLIGVSLLILHFVFKNNKFPEFAATAIDLSLISMLIYAIYFVVTYIQSVQFYKSLNLKVRPLSPLLMILGLPFYGVSHFLLRNKIREDLYQSSIENIK